LHGRPERLADTPTPVLPCEAFNRQHKYVD